MWVCSRGTSGEGGVRGPTKRDRMRLWQGTGTWWSRCRAAAALRGEVLAPIPFSTLTRPVEEGNFLWPFRAPTVSAMIQPFRLRQNALAGGGILVSMRVKTSVTIDERVLRAIDKATSRHRSRSRVIEEAAREFLGRRARATREARDLAILNENADALNREMDDVLSYQADV